MLTQQRPGCCYSGVTVTRFDLSAMDPVLLQGAIHRSNAPRRAVGLSKTYGNVR